MTPQPMKLSLHGQKLIKNFEGLRLSAYLDVAGIWTIGYGSTRYHDGRPVRPGDKLDNEIQATALFANTLTWYEDAVNNYVKVPLSQNQFDALVSFTYNEGTYALKNSTLLKKLNQKDYAGAAGQLLLWNKITDPHTGHKVVCDTLVSRRNAEHKLFLSDLNRSTV
jgi:lysozyme